MIGDLIDFHNTDEASEITLPRRQRRLLLRLPLGGSASDRLQDDARIGNGHNMPR